MSFCSILVVGGFSGGLVWVCARLLLLLLSSCGSWCEEDDGGLGFSLNFVLRLLVLVVDDDDEKGEVPWLFEIR